jgi:membrane fusion protein, multidrug efflux system
MKRAAWQETSEARQRRAAPPGGEQRPGHGWVMNRRMLILLLGGVLILGAIVGIGGYQAFQVFKAGKIREYMASHGPPPQVVSTATAAMQEWQPQLEAVGSLRAVKGADLALEVPGIVEDIAFQSGQDVEAGALLLQLRAEDDVAKLHSLEANAQLAQITYDRDQKLVKTQVVSQATLDSDAAKLKDAKAQVTAQQAVINKKFIRAPFTGRLGIRAVDIGQYVSAGTTIVTLQALDPIYLDFYLPQQSLDQIKVGQTVTVKIDTYPDQSFTGEIAAINPKVDASSRNVQVRAALKNADRKLLPGMFATVDIATSAPQRFITLPQTAIAYNPYGSTVFLVDDKGKDAKGQPQLMARQSFVTTGATRGDQVAVLSGVKEGETVVTAGQIKLRNGAPLLVNNSVQPSADDNPRPVDQ